MNLTIPDSGAALALLNAYGLPAVILYLIGRPLLQSILARVRPAPPAVPPDVPDVAPVARPFPVLSALLESFFGARKQIVPHNLRDMHPELKARLIGEVKDLFGLVEPVPK